MWGLLQRNAVGCRKEKAHPKDVTCDLMTCDLIHHVCRRVSDAFVEPSFSVVTPGENLLMPLSEQQVSLINIREVRERECVGLN